MLLTHGDLGEALAWARRQCLTTDDELSYVREYEHITLARILLAAHTADRSESAPSAVAPFLRRLLTAAETGGRTASAIEILVLQARAHNAHGDAPAALAALERALTLAEPQGHVRVFVDDGPPIATLLRTLVRQRPNWAYPCRLLDAATQIGGSTGGETGPSSAAMRHELVEPLSDRELEVLRLLAGDLGGPDIARHLRVSVNTLRTHTRHIYTKLGVNNRRDAVRMAGRLNLISRAPGR
ncbi:LuxR C-terminal-related transcriptional regulator [Streptomyces sp. NPDC058001]|uniref:LuxR C-terminal-related transcriptional regulator n=1 Tax=Streptomyces sp. NPDC058001 TaxID=3346300 RepID=UPI0036E12E1C